MDLAQARVEIDAAQRLRRTKRFAYSDDGYTLSCHRRRHGIVEAGRFG